MSNIPSVDLVGVGLNATDTLIFLSEHPTAGGKSIVRSIKVSSGGQVATAVVACQHWGMSTRYIGKLGDDRAAEVHRDEFRHAGADARITTVSDCSSAQSFILVDGRGERTVLWQRDERLALRPEQLEPEWIVNARALLVDGCDTAAAITAAKWARDAGIPVIADLDDAYAGVEELLKHTDYLIVSRDFPKRLLSTEDLRESLRSLQSGFGCRLAAATLGTEGVIASDGEQLLQARAYRVPTVDTTGAGDIFHAGFIYGLLHGWPLQKQLDFACAAAALNCTAPGARGNIATVDQIETLMANGERYAAAKL